MAGIDLGTAFLQVVPSMQGSVKNLEKEADDAGNMIGKTFAVAAGATLAASVAIGAGLKQAFDIGATFADLTDTIRIGTGAQGEALAGLADVAKNVATSVPTDFARASSIVADLNTTLGYSGDTLQTVASQVSEAGRLLGQDINIQGVSSTLKGFNVTADDSSAAAGSDLPGQSGHGRRVR